MQGTCMRGDSCKYSHDLAHIVQVSTANSPAFAVLLSADTSFITCIWEAVMLDEGRWLPTVHWW